MRVLVSLFILFFSCLSFAIGVNSDINYLNRQENFYAPVSPGSKHVIDDVSKAFQDLDFDCEKAIANQPVETEYQKKSFDNLVAYVKRTPSSIELELLKEKMRIHDNDWNEKVEKYRTEMDEKLKLAVDAGGWRAKYFKLVEDFLLTRIGMPGYSAKEFSKQLYGMINDGVPNAIDLCMSLQVCPIDDSNSDWKHTNSGEYNLLKLGVARSEPLSLIRAARMLIGTGQLRDKENGKAMAECVINMGYVDGYYVLGRLAEYEGRLFDAFKIQLEGANLGCDRCSSAVREVGLMWAEDKESARGYVDSFYGQQFEYMRNRLPELRAVIPEKSRIKFSDSEIVTLIKRSLRIQKGRAN